MLKLEHLTWNLPDSGLGIVNDVSLFIPEGKLVVITGPNGGGKTTLAKLIAGLLTPSSGKIWFDGADITDSDLTARARMGLGYAFQQPVRFKGITVRDLLNLAAGHTLDEGSLCALLGKVGLCAEEYVDREMSASLSGGESKRIEIATVLARKAKYAIFDEPEAGIDLWSFARLVSTFEELRNQHCGTQIIISHQERILSIADEIIVIADGKIRTQGTREEILPSLLSGEWQSRCPRNSEEVSCNG